MEKFFLIVAVDCDGDPRWMLETTLWAAQAEARDLAEQCYERPKLIEVNVAQLAAQEEAWKERSY